MVWRMEVARFRAGSMRQASQFPLKFPTATKPPRSCDALELPSPLLIARHLPYFLDIQIRGKDAQESFPSDSKIMTRTGLPVIMSK